MSLFNLLVLQSSKFSLLYLTVYFIKLEFTFVGLRYFLEGDRPSQTSFFKLSHVLI